MAASRLMVASGICLVVGFVTPVAVGLGEMTGAVSDRVGQALLLASLAVLVAAALLFGVAWLQRHRP